MTARKRQIFVVSLLAFLAMAACSSSSSSSGRATEASIRGVRYCEVIAVVNDGALRADVYGSQGLSECPLSEWEALDPRAIQEDLEAIAIIMNGPRFWLIDSVVSFTELGEIRMFGDLEMRRIASVEVEPGQVSQVPYMQVRVVRDTEFVFRAGREVYELHDPIGNVYVMQSYAHIVDDTLDEEALRTLGERLELPDQWFYVVRTLTEDHVVEDIEGIAAVVQDELQNTYQLARLPMEF